MADAYVVKVAREPQEKPSSSRGRQEQTKKGFCHHKEPFSWSLSTAMHSVVVQEHEEEGKKVKLMFGKSQRIAAYHHGTKLFEFH